MKKFIDLFAGIGGFRRAFYKFGHQCVFASEIDKYDRETYQLNFKNISPELFSNNLFNEDILNHNYKDIPAPRGGEVFIKID